jgi:drug/metabolite transporter (DMT)-like permease
MVAHTVIFSLNAAVVKQLGLSGITGVQTAFVRSVIGIVIPLAIILLTSRRVRTQHMPLQLAQGAIGGIALMSHFYAWTKLPLAVVTSLIFTQAMFTLLFAVVIARAKVSWQRWIATALGFVGVLIMVHPGFDSFEPAALFALLAGLLIALQMVLVSRLPSGEKQLTMLLYLGVMGTLVTIGPGLYVWHSPDSFQALLLICNGLLGISGQACIYRAFRVGDPAYVAPFDYTKLIAATVLGLLFFAEIPGQATAIGAVLIVSSTLYISTREHNKLARDASQGQAQTNYSAGHDNSPSSTADPVRTLN